MAKLSRYTQFLFGSSAGANQIAKFGSLQAGTPVRYSGSTITPALIQALTNYLQGWAGAVIGLNSPAIEDMNAICYLFAYQLAYIFQSGIPEYDSSTTYYSGSLVMSSGLIYVSLLDNNTGNSLLNSSWWQAYGGANRVVTTSSTLLASDDVVFSDSTLGALTQTLPAIASTPYGKRITIKDIGNGTYTTSVKGNGSETIDGSNTYATALSKYDSITVINIGSRWYLI